MFAEMPRNTRGAVTRAGVLGRVRCRALCVSVCLLATAPACAGPQPFTIVEDGKGRAVIVVADNARATTREAAEALQKVVEQMSGARLPIQAESKYDKTPPPILVGMSGLAERMGIRVAQDLEQGDRYVIRSGAGYLALVGNDGGNLLGSAYAVYDLLQRLGCGWFGPDPIWHVIPKAPTLRSPPLDLQERPDFVMRDIWKVGGGKTRQLKLAWRLGGVKIASYHSFHRLKLAKQYRKVHPEWFGPGQPCLTELDMQRIIVEKFRKDLQAKPGVLKFSLTANDNDKFCRCERCRAVGNPGARLMRFANAIARELRQSHPGRFRLCFLAYWVSHDPPRPMVKAEPEIIVMLVNEGNHVQPLDKPVPPGHAKLPRNNLREQRATVGWAETGALAAVYEWWIPGCSDKNWRSVPWYSGQTALRNLRYWKAHGMRYITYESGYETGDPFPLRWPLYYVGARGCWDTRLTVDQIMTEACRKLYGSAADDMFTFYRTLEAAMADSDQAGGNWKLPSAERIYTPAVEARATAWLDRAARATSDANALARIADERRMWDQACRTLAKLRKKPPAAAASAKPAAP